MRILKPALLPALVLAVVASAVIAPSAFAAVAAGDKAPDFTLNNLDGKSVVKLSTFTNKPTLLVFWVSWCPHCQREVPILQKITNDLKPKGMNAVGVSVDNDLQAARDFVQKYKITLPNAFSGTDEGAAVLENYGVEGVPTIYVIDKNNTVAARFVGETPEDTIRQEFAKLGVK